MTNDYVLFTKPLDIHTENIDRNIIVESKMKNKYTICVQ